MLNITYEYVTLVICTSNCKLNSLIMIHLSGIISVSSTMTSDLQTELSKKTQIFHLKVWVLIAIFIGIFIVIILLMLSFYLTSRKKAMRANDKLPVTQTSTPSKEIKDIRIDQNSANSTSVHPDGDSLSLHDNFSEKYSDKHLMHSSVEKTKNAENSTQLCSFNHLEKADDGFQSGEKGSSGAHNAFRSSPLLGLHEFSSLGWGYWFTLRDLEIATNRFAKENVIGEGGYGVVYRGNLVSGTPVAIKKLLNNL
ncbi:hypothetical protein U1Q18_029866 [Sarracenia purpurea var. burkii]